MSEEMKEERNEEMKTDALTKNGREQEAYRL